MFRCIALVKYLSQCFLLGVPNTPDFMPQLIHTVCFELNRQALGGHIEILSGHILSSQKHFYIQTGPQIGEPEKKTIFTRMTIWVKLWLILGQCSIVGSCRIALPQHCLLYHETSLKLLYKSLLLVQRHWAKSDTSSHTCKKRVMLRRRLFWPKKIAEKVRKSRQNVNRDKSA